MAVFRGALIEDASAEFRHQQQKLRELLTELLAEFRGQAHIPSMRAPSKTVFFSIYRFFNIILAIGKFTKTRIRLSNMPSKRILLSHFGV